MPKAKVGKTIFLAIILITPFSGLCSSCKRTHFGHNAELSRGPEGHRFELLVLPERSEGKEFATAHLRIPSERSEGGTWR